MRDEHGVCGQAREAVRHATLEGKALQTPEGQKVRGGILHLYNINQFIEALVVPFLILVGFLFLVPDCNGNSCEKTQLLGV